jgi:hypothetical protein
MGVVTCPGWLNHPEIHKDEVKVCWICERCPKEYGFKLRKGDYCPDCTKRLIEGGYIWDPGCQDWVKPSIPIKQGRNPIG